MGTMNAQVYELDDVDRRLIGALRARGRVSNAELARSLPMARGTVQSRLARLEHVGIITGWGPELDPRTADHPVTAFTTLSIAQGAHDHVLADLKCRHEVMEVHVVTGAGDLLCRLAARTNDHLHAVIQGIVNIKGVLRSESQLALQTPIHRTLADIVSSKPNK